MHLQEPFFILVLELIVIIGRGPDTVCNLLQMFNAAVVPKMHNKLPVLC